MTFQEAFDNFIIPHCEHPIFIKKTGQMVPCGHCPLCLRKAKNDWRTRLNCELRTQMYKACFMTLTFAPEYLGTTGYSVIQLFIKRFRKFYKTKKIKYFGAFERGDLFGREHYHIIFFGHFPLFSDFAKSIYKWRKHEARVNAQRKKEGLPPLIPVKLNTTSECIFHFIWKAGFVKLESCTSAAIDYVSAYVAKKMDYRIGNDIEYNKELRHFNKWCDNDFEFKEATDGVHDTRQPFYFMSKGLGFDYLFKNLQKIAKKKRLFFDGHYFSLPRAFVKVIKALFAGWQVPLHKYKVWWLEKFNKPLLSYNWTDWYNFHLFIWEKMEKYVNADLYRLQNIQFNSIMKKIKCVRRC